MNKLMLMPIMKAAKTLFGCLNETCPTLKQFWSIINFLNFIVSAILLSRTISNQSLPVTVIYILIINLQVAASAFPSVVVDSNQANPYPISDWFISLQPRRARQADALSSKYPKKKRIWCNVNRHPLHLSWKISSVIWLAFLGLTSPFQRALAIGWAYTFLVDGATHLILAPEPNIIALPRLWPFNHFILSRQNIMTILFAWRRFVIWLLWRPLRSLDNKSYHSTPGLSGRGHPPCAPRSRSSCRGGMPPRTISARTRKSWPPSEWRTNPSPKRRRSPRSGCTGTGSAPGDPVRTYGEGERIQMDE